MDAGRICADLVRIKSENPPGNTADAIEYIRALLETLGIRSGVTENPGGRTNLLTTGTKKPLLLCGHVDVVPAMDDGWTHPPFSGVIEDGMVWGRGATDMKGGCAALLDACRSFVEQGTELPATLAFVCDEETGGEFGIRHLLARHLIQPCDCLIAEPTPVRHPCIGQKGLCRFEIGFTGSPGHGSLYPVVGVSAIMESMAFLAYMNGLHNREFPADDTMNEIIRQSSEVFSDEFKIANGKKILQRITFNPGVITGGEKTNIVAQHCDLDVELRLPWGCNTKELLSDIRAHAHSGTIKNEIVHEPSITDPSSNLVTITCREIQKVQGGRVFPIVQWAASDARHLRLAGFRVIEYGPGELPTLHSTNERIRIASIEKASAVYQGVMHAYAGLQ